MQAPDRYTLRIQLTVQDYNFLYVAAYSGLGAVAREVIEAYGAQSGLHPVGTGAYMLQQYTPHSKNYSGGKSGIPRLRVGLQVVWRSGG
ncbi:hypothetical protein ACFS07_09155 [Undibacterium arcticum]